MRHLLLSVTAFLIFQNFIQAQCSDARFRDKIFDRNAVISNVKYGSNTNNLGKQQDLFLDVYMPELLDDTMRVRPVVLLMHGGAYVAGDKTGSTMKMMGNELSKRGYVAVAVQYRLEQTEDPDGLPILYFANKINWYRAIIRSVHDIKGAIRYLKYTAAEADNPFGIDTNNITLYGSSAGAIGVIHTAFLDESDELSGSWRQALTTLGGDFEGTTSEHLQYGSTNTVRNLIVDSGALAEVDWIGEKNDVDVMALHHNADPSVPYNHGCFYVAACHLGKFYGAQHYVPRLESIGARVVKHIVNGAAHPVDDLMPEFALEKAVDFLYDSQCKYYADTTVTTGLKNRNITALRLYPNPSQGSFIVQTPELKSKTLVQIHSMNGQLMKEIRLTKMLQEIQLDAPNGIYLVTVTDDAGQSSISKLVISK